MSKFPPAAHFIGGNKFDNLQIDIDASHALIPDNPMPARIETHKGFFKSKPKFYLDGFKNQQFHLFYLIQAFAQCGFILLIIGSTLGGRPPNILTFIHYFNYRKRQQKSNMIGKTQVLISRIGKKSNHIISNRQGL